jgi:small basic protein (TIGR04137 family)
MSQHPSLRSSDKDKQHRSVLKRHERLKLLKDKEKWKDGDSVFGLEKVKVLRFKIKKEKAAKEAEGEAAPGAEVPGAATAEAKTPTGKEVVKPQAQAEPKKEAKK